MRGERAMIQHLRRLMAVLAFVLPLPASGEPLILVPESFAFFKGVSVKIDAQISDGCVADPEGVKNAFELELLRSGIDTQQPAPTVIIHLHGFAVNDNTCVISFDATLYSGANFAMTWAEIDKTYPIIIFRESGLQTVSVSQSQEQIEESIRGLGRSFSIAWIKARTKK